MITSLPKPCLYGLAVIVPACVVTLIACFNLEFDMRQEILLPAESAAAQTYEELLEEFGSDDFVIVAISCKPLFEFPAVDTMWAAMENLEETTHVTRVSGIPSIFRDQFGGEELEPLEEEMTSTDFYHGLFISPDHDTAGLLVQTDPVSELSGAEKDALVQNLREAVKPLEDYGFRVDIVGRPILNAAVSAVQMRETIRMFPIAVLCSLIILYLLLRSVRALSVVLICGGLSLVLTLGSIALLGIPLNVVTSSIPLILWVLCLANCIHVIVRYQFYVPNTPTRGEALRVALHEIWYACAVSAITTAVGFLSLLVAGVAPIQQLGGFIAMGMILSLAVNLTVCPALLSLFRAPPPRWRMVNSGLVFEMIGNVTMSRPLLVIALFVIVAGTGIVSATKVRSDPDTLRFLPEGSDVVESYQHVANNLTGMYSLEILIETPNGWLDRKYWAPTTELAEALHATQAVSRVLSPYDFIRKANQWEHDLDPAYYAMPNSEEEARVFAATIAEEDEEALSRLLSEDGRLVRLSVLVKSMKSRDYESIREAAEAQSADWPDDMELSITGRGARMQAMRGTLVETQLESFSLAFAMVIVAIFVGLRSVSATLLSISPNLLPILTVFTTMWWYGIPLDVATVMVASISLGIAVDDAVHFLAGYRFQREGGDHWRAAINATLEKVGPSITVTTVTACIGFFTLSFSAFAPIADFGFLSGVAMIMAYLADVLLLPAIVAVLGRFSKDELPA